MGKPYVSFMTGQKGYPLMLHYAEIVSAPTIVRVCRVVAPRWGGGGGGGGVPTILLELR